MVRRLSLVRSPRATEVESPSKTRVVLADDHPFVRRTLRTLLDRENGIEVVAEAEHLTAATREVTERKPDVLVVDLGTPDGSALQAIGGLHGRAPATRIVVVTMQDSAVFARAALTHGALGFVLKERADTELADAVRAASRDQRYVSGHLGARMTHAV
jgi:DNA-binding NarL/FixJ family response regulator